MNDKQKMLTEVEDLAMALARAECAKAEVEDAEAEALDAEAYARGAEAKVLAGLAARGEARG